jgi:1,2-diacylglycerol 3-alpha-glucosyltransferase
MPVASQRRDPRPIEVFLVCSGLGHVNRGFESFSDECFRALLDADSVHLHLFQGAGTPEPRRTVLRTLGRKSLLARGAARVLRRDAFWVEQRSFFHRLVPHLVRRRPELVYFSEPVLGTLLDRWRRSAGAGFRLLLSNGGPVPPAFRAWDHVQQLTPGAYRRGVALGWPAERQTVLPYGIEAGSALPPAGGEERRAIRQRLGLPTGAPLLLCVAAVDATHKRVDYVVRELAALGTSAPHLVVLGEAGAETPAILSEARALPNGCTVRCVAQAEVQDYYRSADAFVLASLEEGFGRVFLEAMLHGLPCIAHDYEVSRFVLGPLGIFGDLRRPGALAELLPRALGVRAPDAPLRLQRRVQRRFSWSSLQGRYAAMLQGAAGVPVSPT